MSSGYPGPAYPLPDTTVLVTGAAGGIGAAVCAAFAASGARVAATDLDPAALDQLVKQIITDVPGAELVSHRLDVTDPQSVDDVVARVGDDLGPIDVLVNVAGVLEPATVERTGRDLWDRTFAVNSTGVYLVSQAVGRRMAERGRGSIVTVGSNAGGVPRAGMAAYAASKAAATAFTRCLGLELGPAGVRCNVVSPGSTRTAMLESLWAGDPAGPVATVQGAPDQFRVGIPLGRVAEAQDVAGAVLFLASPHARHITLQNLYVDGGAALGG